jgi:homeobox-leucine zipper protein
VEVDTKGVHSLYQAFVRSGLAFGAVRWLSTLQRQCERIASVLANNVPSGDSSGDHTSSSSSSLDLLSFARF